MRFYIPGGLRIAKPLPLTNQARGFATWEANHKHIQFRDVGDTGACTTLKHYKAHNELRDKQGTSRSGLFDDPCPWQLYVGTDDGKAHLNLRHKAVRDQSTHIRLPRGLSQMVGGDDALTCRCGGRGG